jgi:hypothetical protein
MFSLTNFGYSSSLKEKDRHIALLKALKKFKLSKVIERLKFGSNFTRKAMPDISNIYNKDILWLKNNFIKV